MVKQYISTKHLLVIASAMISGIAVAENNVVSEEVAKQSTESTKSVVETTPTWYNRAKGCAVDGYGYVANTKPVNMISIVGDRLKTNAVNAYNGATIENAKAAASKVAGACTLENVKNIGVTAKNIGVEATNAVGVERAPVITGGAVLAAAVNHEMLTDKVQSAMNSPVATRAYEGLASAGNAAKSAANTAWNVVTRKKEMSALDKLSNQAQSAWYAVVGKPETMTTRALNTTKALPAKAWNATTSVVKSGYDKVPALPVSVKTLPGKAWNATTSVVQSGYNKVPALPVSVKALPGKTMDLARVSAAQLGTSASNAVLSVKANPGKSAAAALFTAAALYGAKYAYDYYKATPKALVAPKTFEECVTADIATLEKGGDRGESALTSLEVEEGSLLERCKTNLVKAFNGNANLEQYKKFVGLAQKAIAKQKPATA